MAGNTVVVLGGGTGGIVAAHRLRRELAAEDRVIVVERLPVYRFAPSFLWVLTGERRPEQISATSSATGASSTARTIPIFDADPVVTSTNQGSARNVMREPSDETISATISAARERLRRMLIRVNIVRLYVFVK